MKPLHVGLIALVSAILGGVIGFLSGGAAGSVAGGAGGGVLGMRAGICTAADVAKSQKLLNPAQADKLISQSYDQLRNTVSNKELVPTVNPDCTTVINQVKQLAK
jgi:hypothetical protein